MTRPRIAVVGAGHLGSIHARLAAARDDLRLVAVVDPNPSACQQVAAEHGIVGAGDILPLMDEIDAAIIAAPTVLHREIGCRLLREGKHVLVEKPLATSVAEADSLVRAAARNSCVLQVGHVERFNPAFCHVEPALVGPKYIEARRTSGFTFRSMDIGVVMDLMIHDIELVLRLVPGELVAVQAIGAALFGGHEDMAQARLEFSDGCVVNLTASRASATAERSMSVFCETIQANIDFAGRKVDVIRPRRDILDQSFVADQVPLGARDAIKEQLFSTLLCREATECGECNPIAEEQAEFVAAIQSGKQPRVTGQDGRNAVAVAEQICQSIYSHCWDGEHGDRMGPRGLKPTIPFPQPLFESTRQRKAG